LLEAATQRLGQGAARGLPRLRHRDPGGFVEHHEAGIAVHEVQLVGFDDLDAIAFGINRDALARGHARGGYAHPQVAHVHRAGLDQRLRPVDPDPFQAAREQDEQRRAVLGVDHAKADGLGHRGQMYRSFARAWSGAQAEGSQCVRTRATTRSTSARARRGVSASA
jgi:hypothetical protein